MSADMIATRIVLYPRRPVLRRLASFLAKLIAGVIGR